MIALFAFFVMAAAVDFLSVEWHSARERGKLVQLGALSAVIEILNWVPLWVAITQENITWAAAAVVGSVVGSVLGGARENKRKENETSNGNSNECNACRCVRG